MAENCYWRDRPVLITGATGLLGSWLVRALVAHGAHVVCPMRDWTPRSELFRSGDVHRVAVVRGCVTDQAMVERVLGEYGVDTVFHLAAQTIVGVANRNPMSTFDSNIRGTWTVLEACRRSPLVKSIVVASSDKAYGEQPTLPYHVTWSRVRKKYDPAGLHDCARWCRGTGYRGHCAA